MWPIILIVLAVSFIALNVVIALRPDEFRVTRSTLIAAAPDTVFPHVNELRKWDAWSPWAKLDPAAQQTFEGPPSGVGAAFAWSGNNQVGQGRMTITESRPCELVRFRLEFMKPMKATNTAEFIFKPDGNQTRVTWSMSGKNSFVGKAFGLIVNCDKMIGSQFEKGLADMKALAEASEARVPA